MSHCVVTTELDSRSIYPVADPRRTAGPGPYSYGYAFAWDGVVVSVARTPTLSSCQMTVLFSSTLTEAKEIQAWNMFNNNFVDRIGSSRLGLQASMLIGKAGRPGQGCASGADTIILCRYFAWPRGRTALYTFEPHDFWDFWGGCTVTFDWFSDTTGSNRWGNQTPPPAYPFVRLPDGTLMRDAAGTGFIIVFGGTGFRADRDFMNMMGLNMAPVVPFTVLPSTPADGTLLREWDRPEVYVFFGGAKFWIPNPATLFALGYDWSQVRLIPADGTALLPKTPIDGTLLREQNDPKVFLVDNSQLRWVTSPTAMDARCLPWRHVRIVPDNALAALAHGPDLNP